MEACLIELNIQKHWNYYWSFLEDTCQADKIRSEIKVLKCVNLRLLNLQDSLYNYYYSVRFMLFLNLFVSVLIEIILNEKKVMLVLINNDPRSFFLKKNWLK